MPPKIIIKKKGDNDQMDSDEFKALLKAVKESGALNERGNIETRHDGLRRVTEEDEFGKITDDVYLELCESNGYTPAEGACEEERAKAFVEGLTDEQKADPALDKARLLVFRGSDETVDSYGDKVRVNGWDLKRYKTNPVFLWAHERHIYPVAKTLKVWKEKADPKAPDGKSLMFVVYFPENENMKWSEEIFTMFKEGVLNGVSVGFRGVEYNNPSSQEEREALGLGPYGYEFKKQELLELSAVPIGANPNALQVKSSEMKELCERMGLTAEVKGEETPEENDTEPKTDEEKAEAKAEAIAKSVERFAEVIGKSVSNLEAVVNSFSETAEALTKTLQTIEVKIDLSDEAKAKAEDEVLLTQQIEAERGNSVAQFKKLLGELQTIVPKQTASGE